jgi:transcriptional regulator with XRE-family HTH domain
MSTKAGIVSIKEIRSTLRLSQKSFAEIVGVSPRSVARWEHYDVALRPPVEEKLKMLNDCLEKAKALMGPDDVAKWFKTENEALDGKKPIRLLKTFEGMMMVERTLGELK